MVVRTWFKWEQFHDLKRFLWVLRTSQTSLTSKIYKILPCKWLDSFSLLQTVHQGRVVQKVDGAIHRINHYPVDSVVFFFINTYPLGSDLSGFRTTRARSRGLGGFRSGVFSTVHGRDTLLILSFSHRRVATSQNTRRQPSNHVQYP